MPVTKSCKPPFFSHSSQVTDYGVPLSRQTLLHLDKEKEKLQAMRIFIEDMTSKVRSAGLMLQQTWHPERSVPLGYPVKDTRLSLELPFIAAT